MSEIEWRTAEFNPFTQIRFRGKYISDLTKDELVEALAQVLRELHSLKKS